MNILQDFSLKKYNTFHVDVKSRYFCEINSLQELHELTSSDVYNFNNTLILGGGSNVLFTDNYDGLVIKNSIPGIEIVQEDDHHVYIKSGSGVVWDELVNYCVENNYGGIENLSLIPGTVGAAPIQNIGAYGTELKDVFYSLEGILLNENKAREFSKKECQFGYRTSIFKHELKDRFLITSVVLKLNKYPKVNLQYSALKNAVKDLDPDSLTISRISEIVKDIRNSKLPDPDKLGNAGSFFKNPEVSKENLERLETEFEDIISFKIDEDTYKIPAGWLIEKCGLKGHRQKNIGIYDKQALVIINFGDAKGKEIFDFSNYIKEEVFNKFKIELEREVNVIY